jgi:hypothetical protein
MPTGHIAGSLGVVHVNPAAQLSPGPQAVVGVQQSGLAEEHQTPGWPLGVQTR